MDGQDPDRTSGDPETNDGAHVGTTDSVDQGEQADAQTEALRGRAAQADPGVNMSDGEPPIASAG